MSVRDGVQLILRMKAKKILYITQEMVPYVSESQMSTVGRELPQRIQEGGREIRTFMPKWGNINERRNQLHEVIRLSGMNIAIDETDHPLIIKVASIQAARLQVYFIDNDDYFYKRLMRTDEDGTEYADNAERAIFYARGVLETEKTALGARRNSLPRLDFVDRSLLHQEGLPRRTAFCRNQSGVQCLRRHAHSRAARQLPGVCRLP